MQRNQRTLLITIALVAVIAIGAGVAYWLVRDGDQESSPDEELVAAADESSAFRHGPSAWPTDEAVEVAVRLTKAGPEIALDDSTWIAPTPVPEGAEDVSWRRDGEGEVVGEGTWRGRPLTMRWTFAPGNPQAAYTMTIEGAPLGELSEPIGGALRFPLGEVSYVDPSQRVVDFAGKPITLDAWTPGWLQWRAGEQVITVSGWSADQAIVSQRDDAPGVALRLDAYAPAAHGLPADCAPVASLTGDVSLRMVFTVGEAPLAFPSRFAAGNDAALAPVFDDAGRHPNTMFTEIGAETAAEWAARARALAFGHSDPADPRHGNGGLVGGELGGTLVVPAAFANAPEVVELAEALEPTRVELAIEGGQGAPYAGGRVVAPACEPWADALSAGSGFVGLLGEEQEQGRYHDVLASEEGADPPPAVGGALPTVVGLPRFDGKRSRLTEQALSRLYLDRVIRDRGVFTFATPLVATRNPLLPAGEEALLAPDRDGTWTLDDALVRALVDLELYREEAMLDVRGLGGVSEHWRQARRAELWAQPDGSLLVGAAEAPVPGFTLVLGGDARPRLEGEEPTGTRRVSGEDALQTWVWWSLAPKPKRLFRTVETSAGLVPVKWRVDAEER